jgi:hypothetical protein
MVQPLRAFRPRLLAVLASLAFVLALTTCENEAAGPARHRAALAVQAELPPGADLVGFGLAIDNIRLIVVRPPSDTALDSTFAFGANADNLQVTADIQLEQSPETFQVTIQMLSGSTLLFSGTQNVALSSGQRSTPAQIPMSYAGPGQNVATLIIDPPDSVLSFGGSMTFRPTALDGQGQPVPSFYVSWTTSDTAEAKVDATGKLIAPSFRTTLNVLARTPNNVTASTPITFIPVPNALVITSGCGQSGSLGGQLPLPIVAKVTASDGLGVRGVRVTFSPPAGASVASSQVVTDAAGLAQTLVTLGSTSGPALFQVSAPGLTTVPCSQSAFGTASRLVFVTQPSASVAGTVIAPPVVVAAQDAQGTLVPTFAGNVTITLAANPGSASLSGSASALASGGLATFPNLSLDKIGTGYTLQAAAASLTPATSAGFNVTGGAAARLAITVQPVTAPSGSAITPPVVVGAQDGLGNPVPLSGSVTVSINTGPAGAALTGTATVAAAGGVATFSNVILDKTGTYTLRAQATGLADAISASFDVTTGLSRQAVFATQPSDVTAGGSITPPVVVEVRDLQGNVDATFSGLVTIAIGINAGGGTLSGGSVNAVAGVATFANLIIDKSGIGYTLRASATGVTTGVSNPFTVTAGAAARLAFLIPPTQVGVGAVITPPVEVGIEDALGNLVTTATNSVDLRIGFNPSNGSLGGTTTLNAASGVATFSDLTVDQPGTGYTLVAGSGSLTAPTSPAFNVIAGATQLQVNTSLSTVTAGGTVDVTVTAKDGLGATVTSYRGTVHFASTDPQGLVPTNYTFTAGDNGTHTFTGGATLRTAPSVVVAAADVGNGSITGFAVVTVNPGPAVQLAFIQQPSTVVQNLTMSPVSVAIEDQFSNVISTATNPVTLTIGTNPAGGTLFGGGPVVASGGIAIFTALSIDAAGNGYDLVTTSSGLTNATSTAFNVLPTGSLKTWTGEVGTDWSASANWSPVGVPTSADNVHIPSSATTFPVLTQDVGVLDLAIDPAATLNTDGFVLSAFGDVDGGGGVLDPGTGGVILAGSGKTVTGLLPSVTVTGTVTVLSFLQVTGNLTVQGLGGLDFGTSSGSLVTGNFSTTGNGIVVSGGGSSLSVEGDVSFSGGSETGKLTAGSLLVDGNFIQTGSPTSFDASNSFIVAFSGAAGQSVGFANPGAGPGTSHFGQLQVTNAGGGTVSLVSNAFATNALIAVGGGGVFAQMAGNGNTLTVKGALVDSLIITNMPLVIDSSAVIPIARFDDVTFQGFSPSATQLDISGSTGVVTFTNLKFLGTPPNPGWHLQVHDLVVGNGAFTVTLVTPSPSAGSGARFNPTGGAVINWP